MKTQFIQINDPAEIDSSRATVFDLNKRYIDKAGNMYGLRYNRSAKKVEVIKIMRTTAKNESYYTQKMIQQQKKIHSTESPEEQQQYEEEHSDFNDEPLPEDTEIDEIDPATFKDDLFNLMLIHKERINGIVKNIYNSKLITRENRDATAKLDDLFRNIDIDCSQRIDKIINSYREMTEYPRSLNYYIGRLDTRARILIGEIHNEEQKLKFVIHHEMYAQVRDLFIALTRMLRALIAFIDEHKEVRLPKLAALEKQALTDAMTSIENTLQEIRIETEKLKQFNEYINTPSNFKH